MFHKRIDIDLIPLDPGLPGFEAFINAWLVRGRNTWLVDVGPAATVTQLYQALQSRGIKRLDGILLTHIHLDHAGAAGHLLSYFPDTPMYCHVSAIPHLVAPEKLWQGSLSTLGATAQAYGAPQAVPPARLVPADTLVDDDIRAIATPGHAVHHVSFQAGPHLLAGEAGGVCFQLPSGRCYQRPATPPRFFLDIFLHSLDTLIACRPQRIYFGHYGWQDDATTLLQNHRQQLLDWAAILKTCLTTAAAPVDSAAFGARCLEAVLQNDARLQGFMEIDASLQPRERFFLLNSIKGYLGYLAR